MSLFGVEQEYGFAVAAAQADAARNAAAAQGVIAALGLPAIRAEGKDGQFLSNGMLAYLDRHRIETATPEVSDPLDVVRYIHAGYRLLEQAVERCAPAPGEQPVLWASSICPTTRNSCGCHENYLYAADSDDPRDALIPHLVSRIIYTGSGAIDPFSPGIAWVISPRSLYLELPRSKKTMSERGIVDTVEDGIRSSRYRRLHVIAGDPLIGHLGSYLKVGTTALVLAMIQAGVAPDESVALADPVGALQTMTRDHTCRAQVELAAGGVASALTVQRRLLDAAEAWGTAPWMPPFAAAVCAAWRRTLDELEAADPTSPTSPVQGRLDWTIKRSLFSRVLVRYQLDWAEAAAWTSALNELAVLLRGWPGEPDPAALLRPGPGRLARRAGAVEIFQARGLAWSGLGRFVACRRALCECEIRFGELSERGVFRQLDRAGVLRHHLEGIDDTSIGRAMDEPPAGRAGVRGATIGRLAACGPTGFVCDWDRITDTASGCYFDLEDPLEPDGHWHEALW